MAQDISVSEAKAVNYWRGGNIDARLSHPERCVICSEAQRIGSPGARHSLTDRFVCEECVQKIRAVVER